MDPLMPGDEELRRCLEAYADAHLRPDPLATERARAVVMAQARSPRTGSGPAPAALPGAAQASIGPRPDLRRWRPVLGLLAATLALVVVVGGASAMSGPGGPLYGPRLWIEEATMPSDPAARAEAQLRRIEARLADVEAAATRGDQGAIEAAASQYRAALDGALGSVPAEMRDEHLRAVLSKHLAVLDGLLDTAPAPAHKGLQNAIDNSGKAIERLDTLGPGASPPGGGKPSGQPGASPPGGGKPSGQPGASPPGGGKPSGQPGASPPGGGKPSGQP
jgi:hypothetical protein